MMGQRKGNEAYPYAPLSISWSILCDYQFICAAYKAQLCFIFLVFFLSLNVSTLLHILHITYARFFALCSAKMAPEYHEENDEQSQASGENNTCIYE